METPPPVFLDVPTLLENSQPRVQQGWFRYGVAVFAIIVLLSAYLSAQSKTWGLVIEFLSPLAMLAVIGSMMFYTSRMVQKRRAEMKQLEAVEELMQLRRWPEAALMLDGLLAQPTRTPQARAQGLIYLSSVLARYHRFTDAIAVHEHLLDEIRFDDGTDYALRLARAMAMLREDHLVDADRAMIELRRIAQGRDSAGLALVELYRDVKTGHPAEAITVFDEALAAQGGRGGLRDQLGHRIGDAYGLVAKAYDLLSREGEARQMYEKATLLAPFVELERRYPELSSLRTKYGPAIAPSDLPASGVHA
jgi:tetratricopeptide (TPR) repeat protein